VRVDQVVIVDVKLHYDREKEQKAAKAAAAKPAAAAVVLPEEPAANATADAPAKPEVAAANATAAKPAPAKPATAPLRKLLAEEPAADAKPEADAKPAAKEADEPAKVEDTLAVVEEVPKGPKPNITVFTSIQPLTQADAESVLGTLGSPYFDTTFRAGLKAMKMTMTDDYTKAIVNPDKEYAFPKEDEPLPPPKLKQIPINDTTGLPEDTNSTAPVIPVDAAAADGANATAGNGTEGTAKSAAAGVVVSLASSLVAGLLAIAFL